MFGKNKDKQEEKHRTYELSDFVNDLNKVLDKAFPFMYAEDSYTPYDLVFVSGYYKSCRWYWKFSFVPSMIDNPNKEIKRIIRKVGADMAEIDAYGKIESRPLANFYDFTYENNLKNWNADEATTYTFCENRCCKRVCWCRERGEKND